MCSTGVMTSAWACRSAGTAVQSIYAAARTIATRNRRCENQSRCPSSLLRAGKTQCDELRQLVQLQAEIKEKDEGQSAR